MISSKRYDLRFLCRLSAIYKDQPNLNPKNQHKTPKKKVWKIIFLFKHVFQLHNVSFQRCILIIKLSFFFLGGGGGIYFFCCCLGQQKIIEPIAAYKDHLHDPPGDGPDLLTWVSNSSRNWLSGSVGMVPFHFLMEYKLYLHHMGVSLNGVTPKTSQNDLFLVGKPMVVGYRHS